MRQSVSVWKILFASVGLQCLKQSVKMQFLNTSLFKILLLFVIETLLHEEKRLNCRTDRMEKHENKPMCTFVEPVGNTVEDDPFLPRGR